MKQLFSSHGRGDRQSCHSGLERLCKRRSFRGSIGLIVSTSGNPDDSANPQRVQQIIDRFVQAWECCQGDADVEITSYLPPDDDRDRPLVCCRLVGIDLQQRWRRGQTVLLEDYLQRYPELKTSPYLFAELLHEEYVVRRQYDPSVEISSYQVRFPDHYHALVRKHQPSVPDTANLGDTSNLGANLPSGDGLGIATFSGPIGPPTNADHGTKGNTGNTLRTQGKYELIDRLGHGQFGEVWRAEAPGGVEVAVKIISFPVGHKMTQLELQSLDMMKKLRHSYLLQVQAYWIDGERLFIVMELGDETLHDLAKRYAALEERIPTGKLIKYFSEASEAVDFLHSQHVLHRDIKPANILLVSGHVKVADFGIARFVSDDQSVTATTMGTPLYMAPEVWEGKASTRSDQYSLAMAYAELRMGCAPYGGRSLQEVMNQHLKGAPDLQPLQPKEGQVVRKALAKQTKDRYASCTEFAAALREALEPKLSDRRPQATLTSRLVLAIVLTVLTVATGYIFRSRLGDTARIQVDPSSLRVKAGRSVSFDVQVTEGQVRPSDIELQRLPQDITYARQEDRSRVTFTLNVAPNVEPAEYAARLVGDGVPADTYVHLEVQPADVVQVEGFELGKTYRAVEGRIFAERIYCTPAEKRIELVLIPHESKDDPPTFYMLKSKVTNELFGAFVAETSASRSLNPLSNDWHLGGRAGTEDRPATECPQHPVYGVHIEDAEAFAAWLGGRLPSAKQWDKAAGRGETEHEGPFTVPLAQLRPRLVAYNRKEEGPAPVGESRADVSTHMCTDMAGNGYEYTRTSLLTGRDA